jgi:hypothetical protein
MNLSPHFTFAELTATDTGLPNVPNVDQERRLRYLANYTLEPVRAIWAVSIKINSGFRSPAVNAAVKGSPTSAHLRGDAADMVPVGLEITHAYHLLIDNAGLAYDQLIWEAHGVRGGFSRWIHIGLPTGGNPARRQHLIYTPKTNGKYLPFNEQYII